MAHFNSEELIDSIRHGFHVEDDTGFSTKILGKTLRKCKPGGLPLNLAPHTDSSDSDHSPPFQFYQTQVQPTSILCQQSIAKKTRDVQNLIQARRSQKPKLDQTQIDYYFSPHQVPTKVENTNSLLSRQIKQNQTGIAGEKFSEFAKFEAFENEPNSKTIHIVFPLAQRPPNTPATTLAVRAKNAATIEEFIGLCCFLYTRSGFTPKCSEPWRYSLYMADDSCDFDTELPPIERHRTVGECGFTILALVESNEERTSRSSKYIVNVYTIAGHKFTFELDTLNETLEWLRDEAVKRRQEVCGVPRTNMRETVYELQSLEVDQPLKLTNTISSTGIMDFLLIRKNSSRANFNPQSLNEPSNDSSPRAPLFVQTKQRPSDLRQPATLALNPSPKYNNVDSPTISIRSGFASPALGCGNLIQEYYVDRIHRLKPRCSSKLAIRDDCLELTPIHVEKRRAFLSQPVQKYTTVAWELIGGVDSERHNTRRITQICWLPISPELFEITDKFIKHLNLARKRVNDDFYQDSPSQPDLTRLSSSTNTDTTASSPSKPTHSARPSFNEGPFNVNESQSLSDYNPAQLLRAYDSLSWKFIQIDSNDDDSWNISMKIIEIIDQKNSIIRQLFQHSNGGSRRPKAAVEEMFNAKGVGSYSPNDAKRQSAVFGTNFKKRKSINPVPLLNRMLSKQD